MTGRGRLATLAAGLLLATAGGACAAPPNLPEALLVAKASLDDDGFFLKDGPQAAQALERQWAAARGWTADWMRAHPAASPIAAAAALKRETGFDVSALRLDERSLLFAVTDDARGDAFILRRGDDGRVATAWAIEAPGAAEAAAFPLAQAWSPSRAGASCRNGRPPVEWGRCGPLTAEAAVLAPGHDGSIRFVLHGVYAQEAGATGGQLVTVWSWNGRTAAPLLARTFSFMAEQAQPLIDLRGGALVVGSKESWRQTFACGACDGRQSRTEVRPAGGRLAWGPTRSLTPEVDAVDALYSAVVHGRPDAAASPAALAAARADVARVRAATPLKSGDSPDYVLGMLLNWKLTGAGLARTLCLETDALGSRRFTLSRTGPGWRVAAVAPAPDGACEGAGAHT